MARFSDLFPDDNAAQLGVDDAWTIPISEINALEEFIQSSGDLNRCKAAVARINQMKYDNMVVQTAIATATGQPCEYDDTTTAKLCEEAAKSLDDFATDLSAISEVVTKRIALNRRMDQIFNNANQEPDENDELE